MLGLLTYVEDIIRIDKMQRKTIQKMLLLIANIELLKMTNQALKNYIF